MGRIILPKQKMLGKVKTIDPQPVWIGTSNEGIKRFMNKNAVMQWLVEGKYVKLVGERILTEAEICEVDNKLQRDYNKGKISLEEYAFARKVLHKEWTRVTREKEMLKKLKEKYG